MRTIMLLNTKGGCGKTTLATNMASYYATQGKSVALADFDPQASSTKWLEARAEDRPPVQGHSAWRRTLRVAPDTDYVIMDVPAGRHGQGLAGLVRYAQTVVIPVLPSPIDIRAAADFIAELQGIGEVRRREITAEAFGLGALKEFLQGLLPLGGPPPSAPRLAVVANRIREHTLAYDNLYEFLDRLEVPFLTSLRDTQNYIQAAERGLGIFELAPSQVSDDLDQWQPLIKWLNSKRSLPQ